MFLDSDSESPNPLENDFVHEKQKDYIREIDKNQYESYFDC